MPRFLPALGSAAVIVVVIALALGLYINRQGGIGALPSPTPSASPTVAAPPSVEPTTSPTPRTSPEPSNTQTTPDFMWPQSTLEEVRAAQALADAGDRTYAWQLRVDGGQVGQHHPCPGARNGCWARSGGSGEIFIRFLEEELGWEEFFWDEALSHSGLEGLDPGDVVFVRCAAGLANSLYPPDPERPGCAPTIDELRYERVKINVAQPDREGTTGIWVVTGWEMIEPATQADPRVVEAEATALLETFLQARIDGAGAEAFADFPADSALDDELVDREIPLLYATSTGAPYERSEFEIVEGPLWPDGRMRFVVRLFAQSGATRVEQHFSLDWDESDRLRLVFDFEEGSGGGPGTTENGKAVPMEYGFLDGEVTYRAAYPLGPSQDGFREWDRLAIEGLLPDDSAPRRILLFMADPRPLGRGCGDVPAATDAEALARILESDPDFEAAAPVAVTIGGLSALQMDGVVARATSCGILLQPIPVAGGTQARLYLLDLPGGSARVLGIAVGADEDSLETVLEWAAPVIDSVEFHAP